MNKLFVFLFLLIASVSATCPILNDADSFYCYTDGIQYEPDNTCATSYNCNYPLGVSFTRYAFGSNWGNPVPYGDQWAAYGGVTLDKISCNGLTIVKIPVVVGNPSAWPYATAYNRGLLMQIDVFGERRSYNASDAEGECDV